MVWVDPSNIGVTYTFKLKGYLSTDCTSTHSLGYDYYLTPEITM